MTDNYLKTEKILYISDEKPHNDERGSYVHICGELCRGYAYLDELDLEFDVNQNGIPIQPSVTREQADLLLRQFRTQCLKFGEYPDYVIIDFLNSKFPQTVQEESNGTPL